MEEAGRPAEESEGGGQPECFDRLGEEAEPIDGLYLRVEKRDSGRDREAVGDYEPCQDGCPAEGSSLSRTKGQRNRENRQDDGRGQKAASGAGALRKVLGDESAVNPGADRAGDDENVAFEVPATYRRIAMQHVRSLRLPVERFVFDRQAVLRVGAARLG